MPWHNGTMASPSLVGIEKSAIRTEVTSRCAVPSLVGSRKGVFSTVSCDWISNRDMKERKQQSTAIDAARCVNRD